MKILLVTLMLILISFAELIGQTKGFHYTQEELAIWRERAKNGPYKKTGDVSPNSPGDWDRIIRNTNEFLKNPSASVWAGPVKNNPGGVVQKDISDTWQSEPIIHQPRNMRDAAFVYLIDPTRKDIRDAVKKQLLTQINIAELDFSNRNRWAPGVIIDVNPSFGICSWLSVLLVTYDYIGEATFTDEENKAIKKWFYNAAEFWSKDVNTSLGNVFVDRYNGNWTLKGHVANNAVSNKIPFYGGSKMATISFHYNNRRAIICRFVAQVGVHQQVPAFKKTAELYFKESIMFTIYPGGYMGDFERWLDRLPDLGWAYSCNTLGPLLTIADIFARGGDKSLYEFTTSKGLNGTEGGNKNLSFIIKELGKYLDGTHKRYGTSDPTQNNTLAYLIDGQNVATNWYSIADITFTPANIFLKDNYIKGMYMRNGKNLSGYPKNPSSNGPVSAFTGENGLYPGVLFMYGQLEGKIWPYPGVIDVTPQLSLTTSSVNASCHGGKDGSANVTATGGLAPYSYSWSTGATTANLTALAAGSYTVTVTDKNGSKQTKTVTITQPTALQLTKQVSNETDSNKNGSITLTVSGGTTPYQYKWSTGATTKDLAAVANGSYSVTITDKNNCSLTETIQVGQTLSPLQLSIVTTNASCWGASDGLATATVSGGLAPYSYSWSTGATTVAAKDLKAGSYTLTVTDKNGAKQSKTVTITQSDAIKASATVTNETDSNKNGAAVLSISGGTTPYQYKWSTGATTKDLAAVSADNYSVTITDKNGCSITHTVSVGNITTPKTSITSFTLIDADTQRPIAGFDPLEDNASLNLAQLPTRNLNIRANTSEGVKMVEFSLNGKVSSENIAPFTLSGSYAISTYKSLNFKAGTYILRATPYGENHTSGTDLTITFYVLDQERMLTRLAFESDESLKPNNVFSPNDDGIDDLWQIANIDQHPDYQVIIYNRNGKKVFDAKPYTNNWNGMFEGKPLISEVYYYVIRSHTQGNIKTGSITLIR